MNNVCLSQTFLSVYQITELLNDVERLKQALSGLSQLTCPSESPGRRQSQLIDTLQGQVKALQQQLAVSALAWEGFVPYVRGRVCGFVKGEVVSDQMDPWSCKDPGA